MVMARSPHPRPLRVKEKNHVRTYPVTRRFGARNSWDKSLANAVEICQGSGASLHLLRVIPDFGMSIVQQYFPEGYEQEVADKALEELKAFAAENVPDGIEVQHIVGEGKVYEVVLNIAGDVNADLIVMAARRAEKTDYLLGQNSARVARHAGCSVLIVHD